MLQLHMRERYKIYASPHTGESQKRDAWHQRKKYGTILSRNAGKATVNKNATKAYVWVGDAMTTVLQHAGWNR